MNIDSIEGRELPLYALIPAVLLVFVLVAVQARRTQSLSGTFLLVAIGLRYALDALHTFTFGSSPLGMSWNALASVAIAAVGILVVRRTRGLPLLLLPVAPWLAAMLASAVLNVDTTDAFIAITKVVYFLVLAIAAYQAAEEIGAARLMQLLLPVGLVPLAFQAIAIPLGVTKAGEADGSVSYIGGFHHEAAFSLLILNALLIVCFADSLRFRSKLLLIGWCGVGLFLANYRTSILAAGPLLVATLFLGSTRSFVREQRLFVAMLLFGVAMVGLTAIGIHSADRFADLGTVYQRGFGIIQRPGTFSAEDRHLLSGRAEIWSLYIYTWRDGSAWQHVLGFGPETWTNVLHLYAHNTLVSALYETGVVGVLALLFLWLTMLVLSLATPSPVRLRLVAAHLTFIIVNMATMPFWMIEGVLYYAVLCGLTAHYVMLRRAERQGGAEVRGYLPAYG